MVVLVVWLSCVTDDTCVAGVRTVSIRGYDACPVWLKV